MNRWIGGGIAGILFWLMAGSATAVDVPTWKVGDWWDANRSFDFAFNATTSTAFACTLSTTETYRLTVTDIADRATTSGGTVQVYRRVRSNGVVTGPGKITSGGLTINFRWKNGSKTSGEDWVAVSDLSRVHEHFRLDGMLQTVILIFYRDLATVTLDVTTDYSPPQEVADFPIETVGEQWVPAGRQHVYGRLQVTWLPCPIWPGGQPPPIDRAIDTTFPLAHTYRFVGREARRQFPQTYHLLNLTSGSLWYESAIKEFVETSAPSLDLGNGNQMQNVNTVITGCQVAADPVLQNLTFAPTKPKRGQSVTLTGITTANTTVTAEILGEKPPVRTRSNSSGQFSLSLQSPNRDDNSPATDDAGSFGVVVAAQGVGRKVVTLQLARPTTRTRRGWELYR